MSALVLAFPRCKRTHRELWIAHMRLGGRGSVEEWGEFYDRYAMHRQFTRAELINRIATKAGEMVEEGEQALRELRTD